MKIYITRVIDEYNDKVLALLDRDRRQKVTKIKNDKERLRSISAGLLLRHAYLDQGHVRWEDVNIVCGQYGKPYIYEADGFEYSLSHSGDYVMCATDSQMIGADIQELRPYRMGMAKRFFHEEEYMRIEQMRPDDRMDEFYKVWTAKESAVKYTGRGLGTGLSNIISDKKYEIIMDIRTGKRLNIRIYKQIKGYMACVCSESGDFPDTFTTVTERAWL